MEWIVTLSGSVHTLEELSKLFNAQFTMKKPPRFDPGRRG